MQSINRFFHRNKHYLILGWILVSLSSLAAIASFAESAVLLGDFEDADSVGWPLLGDSHFLYNYSVKVIQGGNNSEFALRLTMTRSGGWCGIGVPGWRDLPVELPTAISLDARGNSGCAEICIDIHLKDNSRWWMIIGLPRDNTWVHIEAMPQQFFAISNPAGATTPDFTKIASIGFNLREAEAWGKSIDQSPATMDIDNISLFGTRVKPATANNRIASPGNRSLKGVNVVLADTSKLPALGQNMRAVARVESILTNAGAVVRRIDPGSFKNLPVKSRSVLVWEGPVCAEKDWKSIEAYLKNGGALIWWGAGLPFSRPFDKNGMPLMENMNPVLAMSQGDFRALLPSEAESSFKLTGKGARIWPGTPAELEPTKCRFLTTNDSTALNTHWPWVEFIPLLTVDYKANNWIWQNSLLTGSVASIFKHHSGVYAGARIFMASIGATDNSLMNPDNILFAHTLVGIVSDLVNPIKINRKSAELPSPCKPLTRANFLAHPTRVIGGINWGIPDWAKADYIYGIKRLGLNVMNEAIQWRSEPDANGSVIDWMKMGKIVADADADGYSVIFDGYCFGYERFPWANDAGGKSTQASSIHNSRFREVFKRSMMEIATRYKKKGAVVALYATPDTGTMGFNQVDTTDVGREAWEAYTAAHGLPPAFPALPEKGKYDLSPARAAYIEFWAESNLTFMREVIKSIRSVTPDMPLMLRGPYLDVALSFRLAAEFKNVLPYVECQETSSDVESYFRGFSERYNVPIAGENGWPKERGSALRMAFATTLLGNYRAFLFSFTAIPYARPGLHEFEAFEKVWPHLRGAKYTSPKVGILIPDTTIWASNPPNFFSAENRPCIEFFMERTGIPFQAVSAQWPKLDGLSVLIDDGRNDILRSSSRTAIVGWIKSGGTLIAFPNSGCLDAAGGKETLANALGMSLEPGVMGFGNGKVVVLADVPTDEKHIQSNNLVSAINKAGIYSPIRVTPCVNQAVFTNGNKTYLVLYNKSRDLVGSMFNEITIPAVEAKIPDMRLTISVPARTKSVHELQTNTMLNIKKGKTSLPLPATQWRVVEFTR